MIESYNETRVVMAPSGEILLALPVHVNQTGMFLDEKDCKNLLGYELTMGVYEKLGYIVYHPSQESSIFLNSLDLFEDLGEL